MATKQSYHQYEATDMPEIRQIRSKILQALKLHEKYDTLRSIKICEAILSTLDYRKLGIDETSVTPDTQEIMENIEMKFETWRASLECYLNDIFVIEHSAIIEKARASSSTPGIFDAAFAMAQKYHERSKKHRPRRRHHAKKAPSTPLITTKETTAINEAPTSPPPSPSPSSRETLHIRSSPKTSPKLSPRVQQATGPVHSTQSTKAKGTTRPKTTTHRTKDPSRTATKAPPNTSHQSIKPATRPTMKAYFRTTKIGKNANVHPPTASTSRNLPRPIFKS